MENNLELKITREMIIIEPKIIWIFVQFDLLYINNTPSIADMNDLNENKCICL